MITKKITLPFLLFSTLIFIIPSSYAQYNNSGTLALKASDAQFATELIYTRYMNQYWGISIQAGYSNMNKPNANAELGRFSANSTTYGIGFELTPFGKNSGFYVQSKVLAMNNEFSVWTKRRSITTTTESTFIVNNNCTNYQDITVTQQVTNRQVFDPVNYTGESKNFLMDTRIGYRIHVKNTRVSFAPYVTMETILGKNHTVILSSGGESVNYNENPDLNLRTTQITSTSISTDMQELYKPNKFNTGIEMSISF